MHPSEYIINIEKLSKSFDDNHVLKKINWKVKSNEIHGLFGINGSGKTTLLRILTGLLSYDEGQIFCHNKLLLKKNHDTIRRYVTYLPENPYPYSHMRGIEYLEFIGKIERISNQEMITKINEFRNIVKSDGFINKRIRIMSKGQKQILEIFRCLIGNKPIILLDEPFDGIDVIFRHQIKQYIKNHVQNTKSTIIYTSHNLIESEKFIDQVSYLHKGKLLNVGAPYKLKEIFGKMSFIMKTSNDIEVYNNCKNDFSITIQDNHIILNIEKIEDLKEIIKLIINMDYTITRLEENQTMEDIMCSIFKS